MQKPGATTVNRPFLLVAACVLAAIVHGSLYPYAFHSAGGLRAAAAALLRSWNERPAGFPDLVANLVLYVPLGFFGLLASRSRHSLPAITLFGLALSVSVELAQFFDAGRVTNLSDVYLNTAGALLGGLLGIWFQSRGSRHGHLWPDLDPLPVLLLAVLLAYRLYPYVPTIDAHKYWHSVKPLIAHPDLAVWPVFRYFVLWLTVGYLLAAASARFPVWKALVLFAAFVFAAKIVIVGQALGAAETVGACLALLSWMGLADRLSRNPAILFGLLAAVVIGLRLQPFDFHPQASQFGWLPFRSLLRGSLGRDLVAAGEKTFLYASVIWAGNRAGMAYWASSGIVAALLLVTGLVETHLPGRSAEITDCVMALLLGGAMAAMREFPGASAGRLSTVPGD